ncbi:MAG TPA: nuclear transport factor 2 family protein [Polyangiaceae bacterium]|jgi:ketosteroid isomerase-like protein|nr:nuclear transport factor 2 family protein [Polyangiaceae bacterium]
MSESHDSPRAVVAATQRALLAGDFAGFAGFFAEDAVLEFPFSAEPAVPTRVEGRPSIEKVATALGEKFSRAGTRLRRFENLVVHETTDPEVLVVEFEALGESRAGATDYRLPDIQVWRVRGGQVRSMRDYLGTATQPAFVRIPEPRASSGRAWG